MSTILKARAGDGSVAPAYAQGICPRIDSGDVRSGRVTGVTVVGVRGHLVAVEAHVGRELPSLTLTELLKPGPGRS
jgi:hypothetical protein